MLLVCVELAVLLWLSLLVCLEHEVFKASILVGTFLAGERTNCLNAFILCFIHRVFALLHWQAILYKGGFFSFAPDAAFLGSFKLQV